MHHAPQVRAGTDMVHSHGASVFSMLAIRVVEGCHSPERICRALPGDRQGSWRSRWNLLSLQSTLCAATLELS